jgi:hypothetical protein
MLEKDRNKQGENLNRLELQNKKSPKKQQFWG